MAKKLHYFNTNGFAEAIRYILHYSHQEFEDIRYDLKDWPIKEVKDSLPFRQLPLYEEGDRRLNQSVAIARYVAHAAKLMPCDPWEQALLDAAALNLYDYWSKVDPYRREKDPEKKKLLRKQVDETIEFYFTRFENQLKSSNGLISKQLSWVDFLLVGFVELTQRDLGDDILNEYPTVLALKQKITSLPGVKEYIAARAPYSSV